MARFLLHRPLLLIAAISVAIVASLARPATAVRPFVLVLSVEDFLKDSSAHPSLPSADSAGADDDAEEWDDFADDSPGADPLLSPSSWVPLLDPASSPPSGDEPDSPADSLFVAGARAMLSAASDGDDAAFITAAAQIEAAATAGHPGAQSALAFLSGAGMTRPASRSRAFLLHKFAADAGDLQSKMAIAYSYFRQEVRRSDSDRLLLLIQSFVHTAEFMAGGVPE
jgi:SEL1 protein